MEEINQRQKCLVKLLVQQDAAVPVAYYAEKLAKSNRTVYSDLEVLQEVIQASQLPVALERKPRIGIKLVGSTKEKMALLEWLDVPTEEAYGYTPEERQMAIARLLLIEESCVTHQGLAEEFHVSNTSIAKDLEKVAHCYCIRLVSTNKGTYVADSEENRQRSIFKLCEAMLQRERWENELLFDTQGLTLLSELFGSELVTVIFQGVRGIEASPEYLLPERYRNSLILNLIIFYARWLKGQRLPLEEAFLFDQIRTLDTYCLADELSRQAAAVLGLPNDETIVRYIDQQLIGSGVRFRSTGEQAGSSFDSIIDQIISRMGQIMHVDFTKDPLLKQRFAQHFVPMIYRLKMGIATANPLLDEIKNQYAVIFSAAWYVLGDMETELGVKFNDDEIAFLAVYFQVSMETSQHGRKILIVCPTGIGTSELIHNRIKRVLPAQDIAEVTTPQKLFQSNLENVDLIISSINLAEIDKPVIKVSPLITEEDIKNISVLYSDFFCQEHLRDTTPARETFAKLGSILDETYIWAELACESKEECLDLMIHHLEAGGIVTTDFRREVLQREQLGETALDTGVAIPHAAPNNVRSSKVFIASLKKSILWNTKRVKAVILLCIAEDEKQIVRDVIGDIHKMVKSAEHVQYFFEHETAHEIYAAITGE